MSNMSYKTTTNKEFRGKGFVDLDSQTFISSEKKNAGEEFQLDEVFSKIAGQGDEVQFSLKVTDVKETVDEESNE